MFNWIEAAHLPPPTPPWNGDQIKEYCRSTPASFKLPSVGGEGLITRSAVRKSPISLAAYAHARCLITAESRCDIFMKQPSWIRFPFRPGVALQAGSHPILLMCVSFGGGCLHMNHLILCVFFVCTQLYPGAILEVCGWKLGRFPQVQGEFSCQIH